MLELVHYQNLFLRGQHAGQEGDNAKQLSSTKISLKQSLDLYLNHTVAKIIYNIHYTYFPTKKKTKLW